MNQQRLFLGCFVALVATAFGFIIRAQIIDQWRVEFNLSNTQLGEILGAGLYPFAISIILCSLIVDKVGYGPIMVLAFLGHVASAVLTIMADGYTTLYWATFIVALSNGAVEAVVNPVTATIYADRKTHYLNILHAGWPGGLVLGGLLTILLANMNLQQLPGELWQWQVGLILLPTLAYGLLLVGQKFPVNERVAAAVPYSEMLAQFAKPMFLFLVLIMVPLAITELGTDSWISDIMKPQLADAGYNGGWVLVYTSAIMFVLRFFAGPIVHQISPLGLLALCSVVACVGLLSLSAAEGLVIIFAAATLYGFGKTFFWPTMLGVVAEQFPRGGALTLNTIAGIGMLSVGLIGNPLLGTIQDKYINEILRERAPSIYSQLVLEEERWGLLGYYHPVNQEAVAALPPDSEAHEVVELAVREAKQQALKVVAIFPAVMFACYLGLILYFRSRGGYKPVVLGAGAPDEKFTGGVKGPVR